MLADQWSQMVAASVSPVVVISAAALVSLALYNRLAAIINRLRAVQRERLQVQEHLDSLSADQAEAAQNSSRILDDLGDQSRKIRYRARLIRNALLCLLGAIGSLVVCSLLIGLMVFWPEIGPLAALMFACGLLMVFISMCFAGLELVQALAPAELESDLISSLTGPAARSRKVRSPAKR